MEQVGTLLIAPRVYVPPDRHLGRVFVKSGPKYGWMSAHVGTSEFVLWFSDAHRSFAASINRRLLMQRAL